MASRSETAFIEVALQNSFVREILWRAEHLLPDDWYVAAGCLFQTVWNVLDGNDPQHGINDHDLIYLDDRDLSWEAEDLVIVRCANAFADLDIEVEVRNQARVHVWYEDHFGVPCTPIRSSADAIDRYAAHACRVGLRVNQGRHDVYAPSGFNDLIGFILRPNPSSHRGPSTRPRRRDGSNYGHGSRSCPGLPARARPHRTPPLVRPAGHRQMVGAASSAPSRR